MCKALKEQLNSRQFVKYFIALWITILAVLVTSGSSEVRKISQSEKIIINEFDKGTTKQGNRNLTIHAPKTIIKISAALTVEPYVIRAKKADGKASGFEVEIVSEALALQGYDVKFVYEPLRRTKYSFKHKRVDAVMDIKDHYPEIQGAFLSDEYITYLNTVVTLKAKNIIIDTVTDLTDKSVIGFQQANIAFGEEFKTMTEDNPEYSEMANQSNQIAMLFLDRIDAIVLDRHIFKYHRNRLPNVPTGQSVTFHDLFKPSRYKIAFRERKVRDAFNLGIKKLRESGRYKEIIDSYIK